MDGAYTERSFINLGGYFSIAVSHGTLKPLVEYVSVSVYIDDVHFHLHMHLYLIITYSE